jgi:hypothetical protein
MNWIPRFVSNSLLLLSRLGHPVSVADSSTSVLLVVSARGTVTTIPGEYPRQEAPDLLLWLLAKTGALGHQFILYLRRSTILILGIKPGSVRMLLPQQATDMMLDKSVYSSMSFYVRKLILLFK